ncbi:MAG: hypothetical protein OHK0010_32950 [Anaerolineales bacterium]
MTGKQIAQAYRAAMQKFKDKMLQDGLTAAEADAFVKQARANGSIASVQGAVTEYTVRKQAEAQARGQWIEQQEAADAAFIQQMQAEQERGEEESQARQQALESYRAGERASDEPAAQPKSL